MPIKKDFKKEYKELYSTSSKIPVLVGVPKLHYISLSGKGDPNTSKEYMDAMQTLFPVAYAIKFLTKKELGKDYAVMPLESLWWVKNMKEFSMDNKSNWLWQALIMQPNFITENIFTKALEAVKKKKNLPSIDKIDLITLNEGLSAQIVHTGPYDAEKPTIEKLHAFIQEKGYSFDGTKQKHHEIYFSDPRKVAPEKLRTIIRQPVKE